MATVTHSSRQALHHTVREIRWLSNYSFVLSLNTQELAFEPGQYVNVGLPGDIEMREYSCYSAPSDDTLDVLIRLVDGGLVSRRLAALRPGQQVRVEGPFGFFTISEEDRGKPLLFVSTGTGIAPYRSFVRAYPKLDYTLLHGVPTAEELYDWNEYAPDRRVACLSRSTEGVVTGRSFAGRTTEYLRQNVISPDTICYLCGNCDMIYEAYDILRGYGVPGDDIHAEVYF